MGTSVTEAINKCDYLLVENPKPARRLLIALGLKARIEELEFIVYNKQSDPLELQLISDFFKANKQIGYLSDAGCPAVADPGSEVVKLAHALGVEVIPLVGPSSLLLALIGSGLNGQNFQFHGYLPRKEDALKKQLQLIEKEAQQSKTTGIFIETPYRNEALIKLMLSQLQHQTRLCIAAGLTTRQQFIQTKSVKEWQQCRLPSLHKIPAVFLLGS